MIIRRNVTYQAELKAAFERGKLEGHAAAKNEADREHAQYSDVASDEFRCSTPGSAECRDVGEAVSDIRRCLDIADDQLTAIRNALTKAGVPEFETTDGGGHNLSSVERIERLAAEAAEGRHLRKLFDDASECKHNVLAILDSYMDCEHCDALEAYDNTTGSKGSA